MTRSPVHGATTNSGCGANWPRKRQCVSALPLTSTRRTRPPTIFLARARPCPYPTCSCEWSACPSGAAYNVPAHTAAASNPTSPFYPLDASCCVVPGFTLRERLVLDGHLDCSVGRPCAVTPKGLAAPTVQYLNQNTPGGPKLLTGTIPPQLGLMTAVEYLYLFNIDSMDGTIPPELGGLTGLSLL